MMNEESDNLKTLDRIEKDIQFLLETMDKGFRQITKINILKDYLNKFKTNHKIDDYNLNFVDDVILK